MRIYGVASPLKGMSKGKKARIQDRIERQPWEGLDDDLTDDVVSAVPQEEVQAIDESLGMQMISIRLQRDLVKVLKEIASYHGIGYQPMVRDLLHRFAVSEIKDILGKRLAEANKKEDEAGEPTTPVGEFLRRSVA